MCSENYKKLKQIVEVTNADVIVFEKISEFDLCVIRFKNKSFNTSYIFPRTNQLNTLWMVPFDRETFNLIIAVSNFIHQFLFLNYRQKCPGFEVHFYKAKHDRVFPLFKPCIRPRISNLRQLSDRRWMGYRVPQFIYAKHCSFAERSRFSIRKYLKIRSLKSRCNRILLH